MSDRSLIGRWALVLALGLLVAFAFAMRHERLDTHVAGVATRIGYWGDWGTRFRVGDRLALFIDTSMPAGYERIYVQQNGEIVGALPEVSAAQLRAALAAGRQPRVSVLDLDPLDPARGVRVRIAFDRSAGTGGQSLAGHDASVLHPLL